MLIEMEWCSLPLSSHSMHTYQGSPKLAPGPPLSVNDIAFLGWGWWSPRSVRDHVPETGEPESSATDATP